jgi:hypothetical protein
MNRDKHRSRTGFGICVYLCLSVVSLFADELRPLPDARVTIDLPTPFDRRLPTLLVLYALPNGNTTEWTIGKERGEGVDWHFDIQHIGAQTRALRAAMTDRNIVVAYLETEQKSWPAWRAAHPDNGPQILRIVEETKRAMPKATSLELCLTGHSGGGSFIFGYLEAVAEIPQDVSRIAFLDSNYNFDSAKDHGGKLVRWLQRDRSRQLVVIAYDDRNITLKGKKVVSDTGGTYRATMRMVDSLRGPLELQESDSGSYLRFSGAQVEMLVHRNPENLILHTTLVGEFNGYLHALTAGTRWEGKLGSLEGPRTYARFIEGATQRERSSLAGASGFAVLGGNPFADLFQCAQRGRHCGGDGGREKRCRAVAG